MFSFAVDSFATRVLLLSCAPCALYFVFVLRSSNLLSRKLAVLVLLRGAFVSLDCNILVLISLVVDSALYYHSLAY